MRRLTRKYLLACALVGVTGCATNRDVANQWPEVRPESPPSVASLLGEPAVPAAPKSNDRLALVSAETASQSLVVGRNQKLAEPALPTLSSPVAHSSPLRSTGEKVTVVAATDVVETNRPISPIAQVNHSTVANVEPTTKAGTLTIDGRTYRVELQEEVFATDTSDRMFEPLSDELFTLAAGEQSSVVVPPAVDVSIASTIPEPMPAVAEPIPVNIVQLDLASALAMVGGQHPIVGVAQWRVQEAYARLDQAEVLWLPSIQTGLSVHRHDGNYQASNGQIVDVNRNSFQFGLGGGATGAGTTPRPGIVAQFHLADAIFQPDIAEKQAWAAGHGSNATYNRQLLEVALAYLELLEAQQDKQILDESRTRSGQLAQLTRDFAEAGEGLQADADRMATELSLSDSRLAEANERIEIASARLAQAISMRGDQMIVPTDPVVVPIQLVSTASDKSGLIQSGLSNRPELKEAQALVAAACDEYKRQKYAPFVPSVLLGFSSTGFGGGVGNSLNNVDERYDFDALMMWEIRNLGFGEKAARRQTTAQFQQAQFEKLQLLDEVAREVSEAYSQVTHRMNRVAISEQAIQTARDSFDRNLSRIRDGEGLPIEVLQSIRALEEAQRNYLRAVADHNEAQFRLQWAMGWPVSAPAG